MDKAVLNSMTDAERRLVAETEAAALAPLDEDELLELLSRIRRARTKYVKNYRRTASAKVGSRSSRGTAYAENQRSRDKAEIFELALARVSRQVGRAAAQSAAELKAERIAAARTSGAPPVRAQASETTGGTKKDASSQAQGARRQARRDAR
jgi:hypothetical protein